MHYHIIAGVKEKRREWGLNGMNSIMEEFFNILVEWSNKNLGLILSGIAIVIYWGALRSSIKNNKISTSASILAHYSHEINNIKEYGKEERIKYLNRKNVEKYNVFNYHTRMKAALKALEANQEFQKLLRKNEPFSGLDKETISESTYFKDMEFMNELNKSKNQLMVFLIRSFEIIQNINESKMMEDHKSMLRLKVYNNLLKPVFDANQFEDEGLHLVYSDYDSNGADVTDLVHSNFSHIFWDFTVVLQKSSPELHKRLISNNHFEYLNTR